MLTDRELQTMRNLGGFSEEAADEIERLRTQVAGLRESIAESLRLLGTEPKSARAVLLDAARKGEA